VKVGLYSVGWPYKEFPNGIVRNLGVLTEAFDQLKHDYVVFAASVSGEDKYLNIVDLSTTRDDFRPTKTRKLISKLYNGIILGKSVWKDNSFAKNLVHRMRKVEKEDNMPFDILVVEETHGWAADLVEMLDIPVVVKLHGPWFLNGTALNITKNKKYYKRVDAERRGICAAAGVIAPSHCVLEEVRQYYDIELPNASVIYNPMLSASDENKWVYENCIKDQILFVGRFDTHKGGDVVVSAFNHVAQMNAKARLVFAGPDRGIDYEDDTLKIQKYIDKTITDGNIKSRIHYLGAVTSDKANQLRRESNITIMASRWENFANTVTEAMGMGCPFVGTNSGGTPEIISHGKTGLLVEPCNPIDLAEKISMILEDGELATRLSNNAFNYISERLDPIMIAKQNLEYFMRISNK